MGRAPGRPLATCHWQTPAHERFTRGRATDSRRALTQLERERVMTQLGRFTWELSRLKFPLIGSILEQDDGGYNVEDCLSPGYIFHGREDLEDVPRGPFSQESIYYSSLASALLLQAEQLPMQHHILFAPLPVPQEYPDYATFYLAQMFWNDYAAVGNKPESSSNRMAYSLAAYYLRGEIVSHVNLPQSETSLGYPLCHHDLSTQNIFVDGDFNITCVIDWAFSSTVPLAQLLSTPGLPHPRDLTTDAALVHAFRSGFVEEAAKHNLPPPGWRHWEISDMVSRFMLLVRFDALQDYHHLHSLHQLAFGRSSSETDSLLAKLREISIHPDLLALSKTLQADDEPESEIKRRETEYFSAVGKERLALAESIMQLSRPDPFFVVDKGVWTKLLDGYPVNTSGATTAEEAERQMAILRAHIGDILAAGFPQ